MVKLRFNRMEEKNKSEDIIIINSYADSDAKEKILINCVSQLKKTGLDILLVSHLPISVYLQNNVNYFIYDKRNELFDRNSADYYWYENADIYFETRRVGIGRQSFAVLRSIQNAISFAKSIGKKFFYHFDYDCYIKDVDIDNISLLKKNIDSKSLKGYVQTCDQGAKNNAKKSVIANFFAFYIDFFEKKYGYKKDINDYKKDIVDHMLEFYLYEKIKGSTDEVFVDESNSYQIKMFPNSCSDMCLSNSNASVIDVVPKENTNERILFIACESDSDMYSVTYYKNAEEYKEEITLKNKCCYFKNVNDFKGVIIRDKNNNICYENKDIYRGEVYGKIVYKKNARKKHYIHIASDSLGDNIAWMPYAEEFREKNNCDVVISTFWNNLFEKEYAEITFINPGTVVNNICKMHEIGWFTPWNIKRNPHDFRTIPLQQTASDILGLDYREIRPKITIPNKNRVIKENYVCIAMHSTAQAKYWNNADGWQNIVNYFNNKNYKVVLISQEQNGYMGNFHPSGIIDKSGKYSIEDRIIDIKYADMFIGVGSGLSWLSWAIGTPTILISGFSDPMCEPQTGIERIHNKNVCNSCFNDPTIEFDKGDWNWCPRRKNFECSKSITPEMVIERINKILFNKSTKQG